MGTKFKNRKVKRSLTNHFFKRGEVGHCDQPFFSTFLWDKSPYDRFTTIPYFGKQTQIMENGTIKTISFQPQKHTNQ